MRISLIAAVAENRVIGKDNQLIWHLPDDLKFFKRITSGHHILMGRKNYESIGRPLPKRTNVIITRNRDYEQVGCEIVYSLQEALELARANGEDEAFVIGGGEIYKQAIVDADRIYLTEVHGSPEGDTYFPAFDEGDWVEIEREEHPQDERHIYPFTIRTLEKNADI